MYYNNEHVYEKHKRMTLYYYYLLWSAPCSQRPMLPLIRGIATFDGYFFSGVMALQKFLHFNLSERRLENVAILYICLGVTCPGLLKKFLFDTAPCVVTHFFTNSTSNLLITGKNHQISNAFKIASELLIIDGWGLMNSGELQDHNSSCWIV